MTDRDPLPIWLKGLLGGFAQNLPIGPGGAQATSVFAPIAPRAQFLDNRNNQKAKSAALSAALSGYLSVPYPSS
jgi:hypothetical protein